jgi:hypothetical protein
MTLNGELMDNKEGIIRQLDVLFRRQKDLMEQQESAYLQLKRKDITNADIADNGKILYDAEQKLLHLEKDIINLINKMREF